ncbi:MAG: MarR family winged helix-turn-helix transcriptional regulator [Gammaproteobacteria bacterium]|jgi:DNA-binding MarR family transcriptional regulator
MRNSLTVAGLVERLSHCSCGEAYRDGLKPTQWSALRYFSRANRFSRTTTAFARFQGTSTAAASQTIGALVQRGLLERTADTFDKRKHLLSLSPGAETLLDADPLRALAAAVAILDEHEQADLEQKLERMLRHLTTQQSGKAFGYCGDCRFLQCRRRASTGDAAATYRCAHLDEALETDEIDRLCANFAVAEVD